MRAIAVVTGPDGGVDVVPVRETRDGLVDARTGALVDPVDVVVVVYPVEEPAAA